MKCKICDKELKPHYESSKPENPMIGGSYPSYIDYYYCPECGIMYYNKGE